MARRPAATAAAVPPPPALCPLCDTAQKTLLQDRLFSLLCLTLWTVTGIKATLAGNLLTQHNVQTLLGIAASEPTCRLRCCTLALLPS